MLDFVLWSFVVALMPVALGLVRALISVGKLIGSRVASPRGGQATRAFIPPLEAQPIIECRLECSHEPA